ncbi:MAG TPA: hypothetical protein VJW23_19940 [Propionibacteriaceae bacterium]|nr:hypothetical protein [Propionibacteriaceae bacterium]
MSRNKPTKVERVELLYPCPTCHAEPERWCRRNQWSGRVGGTVLAARILSQQLHSARFDLATAFGALPLKKAACD